MLLFSPVSTVEGGRLIIVIIFFIFKEQRPPHVLPMTIFGKKCKPGLQLAFARTWSSLSQAFSPTTTAPRRSWD